MSLATVLNGVCDRVGIPRPTSYVGNSDDTARQLLALANEEGQELSDRHTWQALQLEASFSSTATTTQGAISTLAPNMSYIINDTIWNRNSLRPVFGSLSPQRWQLLKASNVTGPYPEYRIRGDYLLFLPSPGSGESYFFEYVTKNWCQDASGTASDSWISDNSTSLLDEKLISLGVRWRYLRAKGLDYSEEFRVYRDRVSDATTRDGGRTILDLNGGQRYPSYPEGSWNL